MSGTIVECRSAPDRGETMDETIDRVASSLTQAGRSDALVPALRARMAAKRSLPIGLMVCGAAAAVAVLVVVLPTLRSGRDVAEPLPAIGEKRSEVTTPVARDEPATLGAEARLASRAPVLREAAQPDTLATVAAPTVAAIRLPAQLEVAEFDVEALVVAPVEVDQLVGVDGLAIRAIGGADTPHD
jgi:hypothetical protein